MTGFAAFLGDSNGTVKADNEGHVNIILANGVVLIVHNERVPLIPRLPVLVGYDESRPKLLQILGARDVYPGSPLPTLPNHGGDHTWPSHDTSWVTGQQILPGLSIPATGVAISFIGFVYFLEGSYRYLGNYLEADGSQIDLTSYIPTDGANWLLIEVDVDGVLSYTAGATVLNRDTLKVSDIPAPTTGKKALVAVKMYVGQTEIINSEFDTDLADLRWAGYATGGGVGVLDPYRVVTTDVDGNIQSAPAFWYDRYPADFAGQSFHGRDDLRPSGNNAEVQANTDESTQKHMWSISSTLTHGNDIDFYRGQNDGTDQPAKVLDNMVIGRIRGKGYYNNVGDTALLSSSQVTMEFVSTGDWDTTSRPTEIQFYTTPIGSTTRTLRGRITDSGDFDLEAGGEFTIAGVPLSSMTTEEVEDIVGAMIAAGTQSGISVTYNDAGASISFDAQTAGDARYLLATMLDTDGTLAANSDAKIASQKAVKTYVDTAVTGLLDFKGSTDASANPNYPSALKGDAYVVSVAGKVGGASGKSVDVGDVYVASADNAGGTEAAVGTSWFVLEHNLQGAALIGSSNTFTALNIFNLDAGLTGIAPQHYEITKFIRSTGVGAGVSIGYGTRGTSSPGIEQYGSIKGIGGRLQIGSGAATPEILLQGSGAIQIGANNLVNNVTAGILLTSRVAFSSDVITTSGVASIYTTNYVSGGSVGDLTLQSRYLKSPGTAVSMVHGTSTSDPDVYFSSRIAGVIIGRHVVNGVSTGTPPARLLVHEITTVTNAVKIAARLQSVVSTNATGAANGFGTGLEFYAETATDNTNQKQGEITTSWIDSTNASRKSKISISAYDTAARLGLEIEASGSAVKIGIFGAAPIVQPTTAIAAATFVANTSGIANDTATWDGYTFGQVVKALRNMGALA